MSWHGVSFAPARRPLRKARAWRLGTWRQWRTAAGQIIHIFVAALVWGAILIGLPVAAGLMGWM